MKLLKCQTFVNHATSLTNDYEHLAGLSLHIICWIFIFVMIKRRLKEPSRYLTQATIYSYHTRKTKFMFGKAFIEHNCLNH
ncbi:hypothetical protein HZS_3513 [Henneguya salminicola]|nr:hypothetical protein HZS_3513 [Henneguya salminicola]